MGLKENVIIGKLIPARAPIDLPPRPVEELRAPRHLLEGEEGFEGEDFEALELEAEDDLDLDIDAEAEDEEDEDTEDEIREPDLAALAAVENDSEDEES
jgi:hypothetical protein